MNPLFSSKINSVITGDSFNSTRKTSLFYMTIYEQIEYQNLVLRKEDPKWRLLDVMKRYYPSMQHNTEY